jgi:creatinine amidohydrolase/Fe(II)-dependent formamide hydrolase-like protein
MKYPLSVLASAALAGSLALSTAAPAAEPAARVNPCTRNALNCADAPNPLPPPGTVWLEEMTWMDVRDALAAGKKTIIIPTGGVEPNGPWVALGKHDYVLRATCEAIVQKLGDALCAPVIPFVPEGDLEQKTGHMSSVGTISVRQEIYEGLVADIARSMKAHGFEKIILISDNGGSNQDGLKAVAAQLNAQWGKTMAYYIPEYYKSWEAADGLLWSKGVWKKGTLDGIHDDPSVTTLIMINYPEMVRWSARVKAGKATIDGVSIVDKEQTVKWGRELADVRASITVDAIRKAVAAAHAD